MYKLRCQNNALKVQINMTKQCFKSTSYKWQGTRIEHHKPKRQTTTSNAKISVKGTSKENHNPGRLLITSDTKIPV